MVNYVQDMLTVQEAAKYLDLTPQAVYRLIHLAEISAVKYGRRYLIPFASVERWLDEVTRPGEAVL